MKKLILLSVLTVLLFNCASLSNGGKCIDYKGPNRCTRHYDGTEIIWEKIKEPKIIIEGE